MSAKPLINNKAKREAFLSIERNRPFMRYGAPVSYISGLPNNECFKILQLSDSTLDLCIVSARNTALRAINKMMKG